MTTVDFHHIRAEPRSKRDSFESLCVLLFQLTTDTTSSDKFVSLRGDGGDGGVEAYFEGVSGDVLGLQAKYFFQLGSSEFSQIKSSYRTALENYPTLTEYHVYIPFDLTGTRSGGRHGTSETSRFNAWKAEEEAASAAKGRPTQIILVAGAEVLRKLLSIDSNGGVRRYWFNDSVLPEHQIANGIEQAKAFAGPRFSSLLDVETEAHLALDFFGRIASPDEWVRSNVSRFRSDFAGLLRRGKDVFSCLSADDCTSAIATLSVVVDLLTESRTPGFVSHLVDKLQDGLRTLLPLTEEAERRQYQEFCDKHGPEKDTPSFRQFQAEYMVAFPAGNLDASRDAVKDITDLSRLLETPAVRASTARSLLLEGPPGVGKTHALVSAAQRRLDSGGYSLVVFGDDFSGGEPWEVIRTKLGFGGGISRDELFECLSACAYSTGLPFVIFIDALNESPNAARWKDKLPEFLTQLDPYPQLLVCVSTRDTYRDLVVDARFPGFAFKHRGFDGRQVEALEAFCAAYGLKREITPLFSDEVSNPLLLHLACKTVKANGGESLDLSAPGFTDLFEGYMALCTSAIRARLGFSNPANQIRRCMLAISQAWKSDSAESVDYAAAAASLIPILAGEITPGVMLDEMRREGLLILTEDGRDNWSVRFGYQKYGDYLKAINLLERCTADGSLDVSQLRDELGRLLPRDAGLLEAVAAILPECAGIEITDASLAVNEESASAALVESIVWRSRNSVSHATTEAFRRCLFSHGLWEKVYETAFKVSLLPSYGLNADWLHRLFGNQTLVSRDVYLSRTLYRSYDGKGVVRSILEAALRADIARWPEESRRLLCIVLMWATSCADRRVRDHATKGLTRVFSLYPFLAGQTANLVEESDDDYIIESFTLAVYSACLLAGERQADFVGLLDELAAPAFGIANIMVRETVRMLAAQLAMTTQLPPDVMTRVDAFRVPLEMPERWPSYVDAEAMTKIAHLPSNMKLGGDMGTDFWRYVVLSKLRRFDLTAAGLSAENVASWMMLEAIKLGYPGENNLAVSYDREIQNVYGFGRARAGHVERLGKKYYWIALHRLVGILARNVPLKPTYGSEPPLAAEDFWSIELRKVDVTDVRDISEPQSYPETVLGNARYPFPDASAIGDIAWLDHGDLTSHEHCLQRTSPDGREWVCISFYATDNERDDDADFGASKHRYVTVDYACVIISAERSVSKRFLTETHAFNSQGNHCYRAFFAEYPRSVPFKQCVAQEHVYLGSNGLLAAEVELMRGREWDYDYASDERQTNLHVPAPAFIEHLDLTWDKQSGWVDRSGELAAFYLNAERRYGLYLRRDLLCRFLSDTQQHLLYARFHNRGRMDGASVDAWSYLRYDGETLSLLHESFDRYRP
ncbi:ATP-binding protein [Caballeronia sordidicola]|uniref:ATP-binding protein n=1 Tax=Caballeronia sordidicola TaxID=196367 RepID=UPI0004D01D3E|nr:ATP-binding protein [Caballeronia sordidicola]